MTSLYNCRELLGRSRSCSELACDRPFYSPLRGVSRVLSATFFEQRNYTARGAVFGNFSSLRLPPPSLPPSPGSRFEDRKNEKKKGGWGAEGDRSVRQKRNIVLICVIDARGRIRFKAKVIERGEQGKKVGGRGGEARRQTRLMVRFKR